MKKKKINSFLLGVIIALNVIILTNILQYFVTGKIVDNLINSSLKLSDSENYDTVVSMLTSNSLNVVRKSRLIYLLRDLVVYIEVYFLIKFLGKRYYISILKIQNTIFTIFIIELLPSLYKIVLGNGVKSFSFIDIIIPLIMYFYAIYVYLVDKEEVNELLELKSKFKKNKSKKQRKKNYKKINKNIENDED